MKQLLCVLLLTFLLSACSLAEVPESTENNPEKHETRELQTNATTTYLTENQSDTQNIVAISFKEVKIQSEKEKYYFVKEIASWLKEYTDETFSLAFSHCTEKPDLDYYEQYLVDLCGKTVHRSEEMVSVTFEGMINSKRAAHPLHVFFALNYNPNTLETIHFSEIHSVTEELYFAFASAGEEAIREENGGLWSESFGAFSDVICTKERFINGLKEESPIDQRIYFYYTEENIGFSFSTMYALGGHMETEISRSVLSFVNQKAVL